MQGSKTSVHRVLPPNYNNKDCEATMNYLKKLLHEDITQLLIEDGGATAIEYGLIAALIAVAAIAAMQGLGGSLKTTFDNTSSAMAGNAS
jgi:pilus assembly protein Flp/PilA